MNHNLCGISIEPNGFTPNGAGVLIFVESSEGEEHVNSPWLNTAGLHVNWHRDESSANVTRIIHHMLKCTLDLVGSAWPGVGVGGKLTLLYSEWLFELSKAQLWRGEKKAEPSAPVQSHGSYFYPANSVVADTSGLAHLAPW